MSFLFNLSPGDVIYDIETYPNVFTLCAIHADTGVKYTFEISDRKNDTKLLCMWLEELQQLGCRMVGFNNLSFDYPVIHFIYVNMNDPLVRFSVKYIYDKAMGCIQSKNKFHHMIWDDQQIVPQVDLFKIHHFDNKNRYTSLKVIEFNMRLDSIQDLPFKVGTELNSDQIDELIKYNRHDVFATEKFYHMSLDKIKFRETLSKKYGKNFINHNDTKIGKDYFVMQLEEKRPGSCYQVVDGKRKIMQTVRESVNLGDIILPNIKFDDPEFNRILSFFKNTTIKETKGVFKDLTCTIKGFTFKFGTGGIHGSVENMKADVYEDRMIIEEWDVSSYYPSLAIVNSLYPEHLGHNFCEIYRDVYEQRKGYKKGTPENAMLKLALNGVYGDSNSEYSPFYDPKYTMSVTINGQLLLCRLIEKLFKMGYCHLLQINTDGFTIYYPKALQESVKLIMIWWQEYTGLTLENTRYKKMFIRDVNSYIAVYPDDTVKRKGAYEYELEMHQNHSALVVAKAAEAYLLHGEDIEEFIKDHNNSSLFDYMLRTKIPRGSILEWGGKQVQNVSRYYISVGGEKLEKIMPPKGKEGAYKRKNGLLDEEYYRIEETVGDEWDERIHTKNKSVYEERRSGIHPSYLVTICNDLRNSNSATFNSIKFDMNDDFYIAEAKKLVDCFNGNT